MSAIQTPTARPLGTTAFDELGARFRGELLLPTSPGYDTARRIWNGAIDRHPACIARCTGTADVAAAVRFARERDLEIAVRGGGHNVAGIAVCDDGIVIDLSAMRAVSVDPVERTALVQGGALWGDVDHETQAHGLATTGGIVGHTGVGGLSLGGGIGWLMRKHGLTVDNLVEAEVVTAEGEHRPGVGQRSPRPVLGAARRRRQLRRRQLVPVRTAPGGPHRHGRTGVLGGRGHHRRPALLPGVRHRRARRARERHPARHDPTAAGGRRGPALPAGHRGGQLLRRIRRGR